MHPTIWDRRADFYKQTFLGPFADEMTQRGADGLCRNLLLNRVNMSGLPFASMRIADYGCGPGNLLEHVKGRIPRLDGIDLSRRSLEIASERALQTGLAFTPIEADMVDYRAPRKYDLILSVNSILPPERHTVVDIFHGVSENLAPGGMLWAILPSFDTTEYLENCVFEASCRSCGVEIAEQERARFRSARKSDSAEVCYADDGVYVQCFHTPQSIEREMTLGGLRLVEPLQKVYYPWDLAQRFDYGFFPGQEEIWDWFAVAKPVADHE